MTVSLTGFMGCGKSSVGRELAALLSCSFIDLDAYIEKKTGMSIPEIFSEKGEQGFRLAEKDALKEVLSLYGSDSTDIRMADGHRKYTAVLSLGGGTLTTPECARMVKTRTLCIYLEAATDTLLHNLENDHAGRPMLKTEGSPRQQDGNAALRERIESLMAQRSGTYRDTAWRTVSIDGKAVEETAAEIRRLLEEAARPARAGQDTVWDPLRKKEVALTPEENVRQWCISMLHDHMKVPMHMMMSETGFRLGNKQYRADIIVYDRAAAPLAVVECKRPEVRLDREVLEQAIRYNMVLGVPYIVISNGRRTIIFSKTATGYAPMEHAPSYEEMLKRP